MSNLLYLIKHQKVLVKHLIFERKSMSPLNSTYFCKPAGWKKSKSKFRPLASHGTPWRYSKKAHCCDTRRHCRSGDQQKRAPPSFLISAGVFIQLDVFVSKFPSFCNSRYCSSVKSSIPMAAAISMALFSGLCSFLVSSAFTVITNTSAAFRTFR